MKNYIWRCLLFLFAALLVPACGSAQTQIPGTGLAGQNVNVRLDPNKATPHRPDGQPDVDGVWTDRTTVTNDGGGQLPGVIGKDGSVEALIVSRKGGLYSSEIDYRVMNKGSRSK